MRERKRVRSTVIVTVIALLLGLTAGFLLARYQLETQWGMP